MIDSKFGNVISSLRKEMGLTQKDLADKLGITDKAISRWETGKSYPTLEMTYQISKFFNVPFNDLMTARVSDDDENDVVASIIKEFNKMNKKKTRILKIALIISLVVALIVIGVLIFSSTYNKFKVYNVNIENEDLNSINGTYIETNIKDTLNLGSIFLKNYTLKENDTISADIYYVENDKEYILQSFNTLNNLYFNSYSSYIKINNLSDYFDKLYLRIKIINSNNEVKKYKAKFIFTEDFSNNKLYKNEETYIDNEYKLIDLTEEEIVDILIKNDFEKITSVMYTKTINKYKVAYFVDSNNLKITYTDNNLKYDYTYSLENDILKVIIKDENSTEIENYQYNNANGKIVECIAGKCNNYKDIMILIDKYFLNLLEK